MKNLVRWITIFHLWSTSRFSEIVRSYVSKIRSGGVEMKVFFDGVAAETKLDTQVSRAQDRVAKMKDIYSMFDRDIPPLYTKESI